MTHGFSTLVVRRVVQFFFLLAICLLVFWGCRTAGDDPNSGLYSVDSSRLTFSDPIYEGERIEFCAAPRPGDGFGLEYRPIWKNAYFFMVLAKYAYWDVSRQMEIYAKMNLFSSADLNAALEAGKKVHLADFASFGLNNNLSELFNLEHGKRAFKSQDRNFLLRELYRNFYDYFYRLGFWDINAFWPERSRGRAKYGIDLFALPKNNEVIDFLVSASRNGSLSLNSFLEEFSQVPISEIRYTAYVLRNYVASSQPLREKVKAAGSYAGNKIAPSIAAGKKRLVFGTAGKLGSDLLLPSTQFNLFEFAEGTVLVFKGSKESVDWDGNQNFWGKEFTEMDQLMGEKGHKVHGGYLNASRSAFSEVKLALENSKARKKPIWIVGHSLGGGLAHVTAVLLMKENRRLRSEGKNPYSLAGIYTYGTTKQGTTIYAKNYNKLATEEKLPVYLFRKEFDGMARLAIPAFNHSGITVLIGPEKSGFPQFKDLLREASPATLFRNPRKFWIGLDHHQDRYYPFLREHAEKHGHKDPC